MRDDFSPSLYLLSIVGIEDYDNLDGSFAKYFVT
jgi:hypothetical protein